MKKFKIFFVLLLIVLIFGGCESKHSKETSNSEDVDTISTVSEKESISDLSNEVDEAKTLKTVGYESENITYNIPSDWNTKFEDSKSYYYPPTGGLLMVQCYEEDKSFGNQTEDAYKSLLTAIKDGVSEGAVNYEEIKSKYIDLSDIVAIDFSYSSDYNNEKYTNRTVSFFYGYNLYTVTLVQPMLIADNEVFNTIIDSINFKNISEQENNELFDEIESAAEEKSKNAKELTSGKIYESVVGIHKNVLLFDMGDSLGLNIYLDSTDLNTDSELFFNIISEICNKSNLEEKYSSLSFLLFIDDSLISTLTYIDYYDSTNYKSSEPVTMNKEYEDTIYKLYLEYNGMHDIGVDFDNELSNIKKKYGLD